MLPKIIGILKNKIVIVAIAITLFLALFSGSFLFSIFGDGDFHTGFNMSDFNNCETEHVKHGCTSVGVDTGCWYGQVVTDYTELIGYPFNNGPIVTSMSRGTGERSMPIMCVGNLAYIGIPARYWDAYYGWYKVEVKYYGGGPWQTIINTKDGQVDDSIVAFVSGSTTKQRYSEINWAGAVITRDIEPITFSLKGSHVGVLRIQQITEFHALAGLQKYEQVMSTDHAFMISGKGEVDLVNPPNERRYIAGVDTVKLSVTTGYSGYTQGGEYTSRGWELKLYDNYGNMKQMWTIGDDKRNTRYDINGNLLDYKIPSDVVSSDSSHMWSVVLTNTLFDQDDLEYMTITQEELLEAPDIKTILFDSTQYNLGDSVTMTLEGIPNPEGRNVVDGFLVSMMYGDSHSVDYIGDYDNKYIRATDNIATITFTPSKGDTYVTVEAWAFDAPLESGGIMSGFKTAQVWIKDKEHPPVELNIIPLIIALVIFLVIAMVGLVAPLPGGWISKIILILLGAVIAYLSYMYIL